MLLVALGLASVLAQSAVQVAAPTVVTGRIVDDASRAGISEARVTLIPMPTGGRGALIAFDRQPPMVLTDRDGRYSFDNIAPGRYRINVQKAGFAAVSDRGPQQLDIVTGQSREVADIALQRGGAIAGRVFDDNGEPLSGARVMALRRPPVNAGARAGMPPTALLGVAGTAESNDLGEFRLFGLAPGEYVVGATAASVMSERAMPRATTFVPTYFPGTPDTVAAQPIVLSSGQTFGEVTIRLIAVRAFQVFGIVRNQAGAPIANALVQLRSTEQSTPAVMMMTSRNQVHTDSAGRFTIANVTAGTYTLSAAPPIVTSRAGDRGGLVSGFVSGGVSTETRNGVTTEWRDDAATRLPITIADSDMEALEIVVR